MAQAGTAFRGRWGVVSRYLVVFSTVALMGKSCDVDVTDPNVAAAITEVNAEFRRGYVNMLNDIGTRHFDLDRARAFRLIREVFEELGFQVVNSESDYYLSVTAPAPIPLDEKEWRRAVNADQPVFRQIVSKHLGLKGRLAKLDPTGLNIDGVITLNDRGTGTDISITFRFREVKPQPEHSILPRREYPPPTASRMGYEKIWQRFETISGTEARSANRS